MRKNADAILFDAQDRYIGGVDSEKTDGQRLNAESWWLIKGGLKIFDLKGCYPVREPERLM